jgi:hypothetical protein
MLLLGVVISSVGNFFVLEGLNRGEWLKFLYRSRRWLYVCVSTNGGVLILSPSRTSYLPAGTAILKAKVSSVRSKTVIVCAIVVLLD